MQPMLLLRNCLKSQLLLGFILFLTCTHVHAYAGSQNDHPVTLNGNTTLRAVFKAIKQQTGLAVMYSTAATALNQDEKMTVNFKETPLDDVLAYVLRGKELEWKYSDDVLVIRKKEPVPAEKKMVTDSTVTPAMLTGKVTDANGGPIPGVTVLVKGTNQGTTTDANGNFSLAKVDNGSTLIVTSIGYEKREVIVKGRTVLTKLNLQVNQLDETVAIAYGTTTQRLSTGNIATIKAKDIEKQPVNNPLLALQGRVPGLFITQANGYAGSGVKVRIQGQNSILNGNAPLYVIDGVPYPAYLQSGINLGPQGSAGELVNSVDAGTGSALTYINPSDIESIQVLKDADATAIYGSRAANGAILITTKKGKEGKTIFDVNVQNGWSRITRKLKMLNTPQYLEMRHEAFKNDGITPTIDNAPDLFLWDTTRYTDWQKALIGGTARFTNVNASFSGGSAATQYMIRGRFQRETTVLPGDFSDQRGSLYFSLNNASANQKFTFQLTGTYSLDNNQLPGADLTSAAAVLEPSAPPLYNIDGTLNWMPNAAGASTWNNPIAGLLQTYQNKTSNIIGNLTVAYKILPELELRNSLGYNYNWGKDLFLTPQSAIQPDYRFFMQRTAIYGSKNISSWITEPQLTYKKNIGPGKLDFLLGATLQQNDNNGESTRGRGYNSDLVLKNILAATSFSAIASFATTYKYNALFSRLNYNLKDKYIINLTARRDGSSRFGVENQLHTFGAIGAAWLFNEENLIKRHLTFLSFGKLRGSYGITGSDQIGDYNYLNLYYPVSIDVPYQGTISLSPAGLPNPYLEWEATKKLQLGLELGFLNDRILLNTNYARNTSSNQLLFYSLPTIAGLGYILQNFPATIQNTSFEFSLNTTNLKGKCLNWTTAINLTIPKNKLSAFPDLKSSTYADYLIIGQPLGVIKAFHFLGTDPTTGKYIFSDINGKPTDVPDEKDMTALLNAAPKFYGGFQNNFSYKGFQLDLLFQFVKQIGENRFFNNGSSVTPGQFIGGYSNQPVTVLSRWRKPGDITNIQQYSTGNLTSGYAQLSDAGYTDDASFIRLKNLSISYQFPEGWKQKVHLQNCRVFLQGQNLLTITKYQGLDPETQGSALPPLKTLTVGLQLTF